MHYLLAAEVSLLIIVTMVLPPLLLPAISSIALWLLLQVARIPTRTVMLQILPPLIIWSLPLQVVRIVLMAAQALSIAVVSLITILLTLQSVTAWIKLPLIRRLYPIALTREQLQTLELQALTLCLRSARLLPPPVLVALMSLAAAAA